VWKIKEKLKRFEQSSDFALFALFGLVISIGLFVYYQDFQSLNKRKEKRNNYELILKAKVTDIVPVEHLSMYFDGNKVQTLGYRIFYEYEYENEKIKSFDIIKNRETKLAEWRKIKNLKINDSVDIKVNNDNYGESILYLYSN